jgi:hypothetical protein
MKTLRDIEADVLRAAARIGASDQDLPTYGISRDFGRPHVEVDHGLYHYVVVERGEERDHRSSDSYDDLLFWIFRDVTHSLAFSHELQNRVEDQDAGVSPFPSRSSL